MSKLELKDVSLESSHVICYKGFITEVVDADTGIYMIDGKIMLYVVLDLLKESLKECDEIFLSNVHFMIVNNQKFLITCAFSTIITDIADQKDGTLDKDIELLDDHQFCFPDLFVKKSYVNFNSYIVKQYLWNSFYNHRLRTNAGEKWKSNFYEKIYCMWHSPNMCKKPFTEEYDVPSIIFLLSEAKRRIVWSKQSSSWHHCVVKSNKHYILVGFLHLMKNGSFALSDSHTVLPCVFINDITLDSSNSEVFIKMICEISSGNVGYYISLKDYCFVFEKFVDNLSVVSNYICIKLSCLKVLEKLTKSKSFHLLQDSPSINNSSNFSRIVISPQPHLNFSGCNRTNSTIVQSLRSNSTIEKSFTETLYLFLEFIVTNKLWTLVDQKIIFSKALVVLFKEELVSVDSGNFSTFVPLSETTNPLDEDVECVELSILMKSLCLRPKSKTVTLNFVGASSKLCSNLLPMHKYKIFIPYNSSNFTSQQEKPHTLVQYLEKHGEEITSINIDNSIKIIHSSECFLKDENLEITPFIYAKNIRDILHQKNISKEDRIRGILLDKSFEKDFNTQNKVLRLVLKDLETMDVLKIYITHFPNTLFGLIPGVTVDLMGFICVISQKGTLYLRSSNTASLDISNLDNASTALILQNNIDASVKCCDDPFWLRSLHSTECPLIFESFTGFVLKIISAHVCLTCVSCFTCVENSCTCASEYVEFAEVSFDIDDGSNRVTVHGSSKILKFLINLPEAEYNALIQHTVRTKQCLKFSHVTKCMSSQSFMNRVFHLLCSNHNIKKPVYLNCYLQKISDCKSKLMYSCICEDISDIHIKDINSKFFMSLL